MGWFVFDYVNFPLLDGDVPRRPSYLYISTYSLLVLVTSIVETYSYPPSSQNKTIGIINSTNHFPKTV